LSLVVHELLHHLSLVTLMPLAPLRATSHINLSMTYTFQQILISYIYNKFTLLIKIYILYINAQFHFHISTIGFHPLSLVTLMPLAPLKATSQINLSMTYTFQQILISYIHNQFTLLIKIYILYINAQFHFHVSTIGFHP